MRAPLASLSLLVSVADADAHEHSMNTDDGTVNMMRADGKTADEEDDDDGNDEDDDDDDDDDADVEEDDEEENEEVSPGRRGTALLPLDGNSPQPKIRLRTKEAPARIARGNSSMMDLG